MMLTMMRPAGRAGDRAPANAAQKVYMSAGQPPSVLISASERVNTDTRVVLRGTYTSTAAGAITLAWTIWQGDVQITAHEGMLATPVTGTLIL